MSASQVPGRDAKPFLLLAALEQYEVEVNVMVLRWAAEQDFKTYQRVSHCMNSVRNLCASTPEVAVQWIALLIAHTELMHNLWRQKEIDSATCELQILDLRDCIKSLSAKCRRLIMETDDERSHKPVFTCVSSASRATPHLPLAQQPEASKMTASLLKQVNDARAAVDSAIDELQVAEEIYNSARLAKGHLSVLPILKLKVAALKEALEARRVDYTAALVAFRNAEPGSNGKTGTDS